MLLLHDCAGSMMPDHAPKCPQPSKDCVQKTLKRLEEKIAGKVLDQILYSMNCSDPTMQHRTATALARLAREADLKRVFVDRKGLDILLAILTDANRDATCHKEAAGALPCVLTKYPYSCC